MGRGPGAVCGIVVARIGGNEARRQGYSLHWAGLAAAHNLCTVTEQARAQPAQ